MWEGGWVKVSTMIGRRQKLKKKKNWLKRSKAVPWKTKLDQNVSDSKSHIWNSFLKILFRANSFIIFLHMFQWTSSELFFNFRFSSKKSQSQQKLEKRSLILQYSFAQNTSLILRTSTHLTSKIIWSHNTAKNLSGFINFPVNMFLFGVKKNICTAPFLDGEELHAWNTLKADVCIFLYISIRKCLFQRRTKILYGWGRLGEAE